MIRQVTFGFLISMMSSSLFSDSVHDVDINIFWPFSLKLPVHAQFSRAADNVLCKSAGMADYYVYYTP